MNENKPFLRWVLSCSVVASSLLGSYVSITRAKANLAYRENTIESLNRAALLDPENAAVHLALGMQQDLAGKDPAPEFRAAAKLDPLVAEPWLRLGLLAESRGDPIEAERLLLHAADIDH